MTDEKTHGGNRHGSGRPPQLHDAVRVNLRMSAAQREKMMRNGGSAWVRALIDAAQDVTVKKPLA